MLHAAEASHAAASPVGSTGAQHAEHTFVTLDAMRGVAAIGVLGLHLRMLPGPPWHVMFGFRSGYLAVDLFFLLSGFVLAFAYDDRLSGALRPAPFMILRLIRLMPMIVFATVLAAISTAITAEADAATAAGGIALSAVVIPNPWSWNKFMFPANPPEWSLFFEICASFAYAVTFAVVRGARLVWLVGVAALGIVACALAYHGLNQGWSIATLHGGAVRTTFSFFAGVLLARTRRSWQPLCPSVPGWLIILLLVGGLAFPAPHRFRIAYDIGFVLLFSPALVMLGSVARSSGHRLAGLLAAGSYPLYAMHVPVLKVLQWAYVPGSTVSLVTSLVVAILLLPASLVVAAWYDEPVRRMIARRRRSGRAVRLEGAHASG